MSTSNPKRSPTPLRSDEPIQDSDQDKLARAHLVEIIGGHILHATAPECVVIALNAPWGAGKSSFLNLLEQRLAPSKPTKTTQSREEGATPIIVRFNPWNYTTVEQILRMFFRELAHGIGTSDRHELAQKIGNLLRAAGNLAGVLSAGAGVLSPGAGDLLKEAGTAVGGLLKDAGTALKDEKTLPELKRELDNLLPKLERRVVVFVDDIDRLEQDALRLLFRMVRLNADFSNVTYVLAFDRLVVERSLDEDNGIRGRDYLEKIIQVSFDIPEPEPSTRHRILFQEMDAVLESLKTRPLDQHRWGNVFNSGFKEHFVTIRHIKRYANGLRLTLAPIAEEVDLVDFLVIELLRVFHPEVYLGVARGKDILTPRHSWHRDDVPAKRLKEWVEELSAKASTGLQKSVLELLRQLFPELGRAYDNHIYGESSLTQWRRDCRVCAPEVFDKFFLLAIPEGEISEVEMTAFVDLLADPVATRAYLQRSIESGKARRLLERLEDFTKDLAIENVPRLVSVLAEEGDQLRFESMGMLDTTADLQVPRIIYQCLARLASEQERQALLLDCVKAGTGLYTAVQEVSLYEPKGNETAGQLISDRTLWEQLRDATVPRIRAANASGALWKAQRLPYVLFHWLQWTNDAEVRAAVTQHVADDECFLTFIKAFATKSQSLAMGDKIARKHVKLSKKLLAKFTSLEDVAARLRIISGLGGTVAEAAVELLALLEKKSEGPWDDD